jgi:hypothetical protein
MWLLLLLFIMTGEAGAGLYRNYTLVSLDVSAYADGGFHLLRFEGKTEAGGVTNFFVDDICVTIFFANGTNTTDCVVQDGGFEAGTVNTYWTQQSSNFETPLEDCPNSCDANLGIFPHSGNWWAWFGGTELPEFGYVQQNVMFPAGDTAILDFYLSIPYDETTGYLKVTIDEDVLFEVTTPLKIAMPWIPLLLLD